MGDLVHGDDGLPAEEVGSWAKEKHELLCKYVDTSRSVRSKFIGLRKGGATYIDIFAGTGRAKVRRTGEYIDGSCVAAWKMSVNGGSPFSKIYIADADKDRLSYATERLKALGAPVESFVGPAHSTVKTITSRLNPYGLHFAFIDPFNLGAFEFSVIEKLSKLKRIDMLVHISKMDLQRNLGFNLTSQQTAFETFAPGWKQAVNMQQSQQGIRKSVFDYWQSLVKNLGVPPSTESRNQHLYWLLLAAKHELAHKFWKSSVSDGQGSLF